MEVKVAGENALIIYPDEGFEAELTLEQGNRLYVLEQRLRSVLQEALIDTILSYRSLLVLFDPYRVDHFTIRQQIRRLAEVESEQPVFQGKRIELPCWYDTQVGWDLQRLSERSGLTIEEIISLHSETDYRLFAIGFAPGFAYLGEVDPRLALPRLETPRAKVPQGSVAIADRQTAVYPSESPGGWNIIGRCPLSLFNPNHPPHLPFSPGDSVHFKPISKAQFIAMGGKV